MEAATILNWAVAGCFAYLLAVYSWFVLLLVASVRQHRQLTIETRAENYDMLAESRFTIPVSVIAPAYNEAVVIEAAVRSLLALRYPEFEVIVVNDGSRDDTLAVLRRAFQLERREVFYRKRFNAGAVRAVYGSRTFPNLIVVDQENGGKAAALNTGLNFAQYRYVCTVDSDTVYVPDALVRSMRVAMRDPARVIGVTSNVTISRQPERRAGASILSGERMLTRFQLLEYLRAFLNNRLGWTRGNFMLCSVGAFAIWRHDVLVELGGFAPHFTCEDIELTFRAHERLRREKRPFRIVALSESVGRTEGPDTVGRLVSQRARWQRVITETVWHYRRMLFNPRYGSVGLMGAPYYLIVEVLAPIVQTLSIVLLPIAFWVAPFQVREFVLLLIAITLANGIFTNIALLLSERGARTYSSRDLLGLMLLGPADLVVYRPILMFAQAKGLLDFLRGRKAWNKFERNHRAAAAAEPPAERAA